MSVHRLVQAVTLDQMSAELASEWKRAAAALIDAAIPGRSWPLGDSLKDEERAMIVLMEPEDRARYLLQKRIRENAEMRAPMTARIPAPSNGHVRDIEYPVTCLTAGDLRLESPPQASTGRNGRTSALITAQTKSIARTGGQLPTAAGFYGAFPIRVPSSPMSVTRNLSQLMTAALAISPMATARIVPAVHSRAQIWPGM